MIEPYHSLLLIALAGYFDFSRGGHGQWTRKIIPFISHKHIFLFLLASLYVYVIEGFTWHTFQFWILPELTIPLFSAWSFTFIAWMTFFGVALGTGDPMGKITIGHSAHGNDDNKMGKNENWMLFGTENAFTNHAILGGLWVLPSVLLTATNFIWIYVFIAHVVSFYFMSFAVRLLSQTERWSRLEMLRSAGAMAITLTMATYL
jgi:hypothetical protein